MNHIFTVLEGVSLSPKEKEVYLSFKKNPRNPLPIVEILLGKGFKEDALELLAWGIKQYPNQTSLRVAYAREFFYQGLIWDAHQVLTENKRTFPYEDNVLANTLGLQTSILLDQERLTHNLFSYLEESQTHNGLTRTLARIFSHQGLGETKRYLIEELSKSGQSVFLPSQDLLKTLKADVLVPKTECHFFDPAWTEFKIVPLEQVFSLKDLPINPDSPLIDRLSAGKIYENQGHYSKALDLYRKLYLENPRNEELKIKMIRMSEKLTEQKKMDLQTDAHLALKIDSIQKINHRIHLLNGFLRGLTRF
jgi:tetratricopeptide (TPR) repeat protein